MYRTFCITALASSLLYGHVLCGQEPGRPPGPAPGQTSGQTQGQGLTQTPKVEDGGPSTKVRDRSKEVRHVFRILAQFPKEVRDAVPVVAQVPELPGKILDLVKKEHLDYVDQILANHPKDVQDATRLLTRWPEVLELMALHTNLMRFVGESYKKDGMVSLQAILGEMKGETESSRTSTETWARRLQDNPVALQQYFEAIASFMQEKPGADYRDFGFGLAFDAQGNTATIYALPAAPLAMYAVANADLYPELADEMVEQWLRTNSNTDFDLVFQRAWEVFHQIFTDDFMHPEGRSQRLRETALLGKRMGKEFKEGELTLLLQAKYLRENAADFPALQKFLVNNTDRQATSPSEAIAKPRVPAKPASARAVASADPQQPTTARRRVPARVVAGDPNLDQQIRRGALASDYFLNQMVNQPQQPGMGIYPPTNWAVPPAAGQLPWWYGRPLRAHPQGVSGNQNTNRPANDLSPPWWQGPPIVPTPMNRGTNPVPTRPQGAAGTPSGTVNRSGAAAGRTDFSPPWWLGEPIVPVPFNNQAGRSSGTTQPGSTTTTQTPRYNFAPPWWTGEPIVSVPFNNNQTGTNQTGSTATPRAPNDFSPPWWMGQPIVPIPYGNTGGAATGTGTGVRAMPPATNQQTPRFNFAPPWWQGAPIVPTPLNRSGAGRPPANPRR